MNTYRRSEMQEVRECYNTFTEAEKNGLKNNSLTLEQVSSIDHKLQRQGMSFSEHYEELRRCLFDEKTEINNLEEKASSERKNTGKNEYAILFTKQGEVEGNLTAPIGGISLAKSVGGNQSAVLGLAFNYAQSVGGNQEAVFGAAINYANSVSVDQGNLFGAAINYANSVSVDQGNLFGVAINYAQSVGGIQGALLGAAINYAQSVSVDQGIAFGAAINYAQSVGVDQGTAFGAAVNYAQSVGGNQGAAFGAAINYAEEVLGSQFAFSGCAINVARRVGKNQMGLVNIVWEEIKGKQIGLFNYARNLAEGARQYGLVNLHAKHSKSTKRRRTSGPERWWNPEISFFYRMARIEDDQRLRFAEDGETTERGQEYQAELETIAEKQAQEEQQVRRK